MEQQMVLKASIDVLMRVFVELHRR